MVLKNCRATLLSAIAMVAAVAAAMLHAEESKGVLRAGIIGLDTSHVIAFTQALNDPAAPPEFAGVKVVAAFPGGSPDNPLSADRIAQFSDGVRKMHVELVDNIDELLKKVDVVLLESVDGRPHLQQARPVLVAGKRLFIDKPMAAALADAAKSTGISADVLREHPNVLIGSLETIVDKLYSRRDSLGVNYVTVQQSQIESFATVVDRLHGH